MEARGDNRLQRRGKIGKWAAFIAGKQSTRGWKRQPLPSSSVAARRRWDSKTNNWSYLDQLAGKCVSIDQLDRVIWSMGWFGPTAAFGWFKRKSWWAKSADDDPSRTSFWLDCWLESRRWDLRLPIYLYWVSFEDECAPRERSARKTCWWWCLGPLVSQRQQTKWAVP